VEGGTGGDNVIIVTTFIHSSLQGSSMAMSINFLFLFLGLCGGSLAQHRDDLTVTTLSGKVQGMQLSVLGSDVRAFLGVPYAKPPIGELRFRPPQPVPKWEGVKNAAQFANTCYQPYDTSFPGAFGTLCMILSLCIFLSPLHSCIHTHTHTYAHIHSSVCPVSKTLWNNSIRQQII